MDYNVTAALRYVRDGRRPLLRRAVRLFEMQVAIVTCLKGRKRTAEDPPGDLIISCADRMVESAYLISTVRLLDHVAKSVRRETGGAKPPRIADLYAHGAAGLLRSLVYRGGIKRGLRAFGEEEFTAELQLALKQSSTASCVYDFLIRAAVSGLKGSQANIAAANILIFHESYDHSFLLEQAESTVIKNEPHFRDVSALLYLGHQRGIPLIPSYSRRSHFCRKLLAQVEDQESFSRLLASYPLIAPKLRPYKIFCMPLGIESLHEASPLHIKPLPPALIEEAKTRYGAKP